MLFSKNTLGQSQMSIIPQPQRVVNEGGGFFNIDKSTQIVVTNPAIAPSAKFLKSYLKRYYGLDVKIVKGSGEIKRAR